MTNPRLRITILLLAVSLMAGCSSGDDAGQGVAVQNEPGEQEDVIKKGMLLDDALEILNRNQIAVMWIEETYNPPYERHYTSQLLMPWNQTHMDCLDDTFHFWVSRNAPIDTTIAAEPCRVAKIYITKDSYIEDNYRNRLIGVGEMRDRPQVIEKEYFTVSEIKNYIKK